MIVGPLGFPRLFNIGPFTRQIDNTQEQVDELAQQVERDINDGDDEMSLIETDRGKFILNCIETIDAQDILSRQQLENFTTEEIQDIERRACEQLADSISL